MTDADAPDPAYCDCTGTLTRRPQDHATDCPRWQPPHRGPGSSDEARERAMADIRRAISKSKEGHA